jgi:3-oxoadipate CoA-transferase beta subunit
MAREVALDLQDGWYVNLGIGLPSLVAEHLPDDREIVIHCENGMLGMGPPPEPGEEDQDLVDAGKRPVSLLTGGSYISHSDSFAIIRGGHLDASIMGAYEVSATGDLANWTLGGGLPAVGGAMDLAVGARSVVAMTRHNAATGAPKLVKQTALPLTARRCVARVYTDVGIFVPGGDTFEVVALVNGVSLEEVQAITGAPLGVGAHGIVPLPR